MHILEQMLSTFQILHSINIVTYVVVTPNYVIIFVDT